MVNEAVNMNLLPIKAHYFFNNGGLAPILANMPTYARQLGLSSLAVGTIYTFLPLTAMLAKPIFGAVADRFRIQKILFIFFQFLTAIMFFNIFFVPEITVETKVHLECGDGEVFFDSCVTGKTLDDTCTVKNIISQSNTNDTVSCQMRCELPEPGMWNTVCKYWHGEKYCNKNYSPNENVEFTAYVPMYKTLIDDNNCIHFKVDHISFDNGNLTFATCPTKGKNITHISTVCSTFCNSSLVNEVNRVPQTEHSPTGFYQFWLFCISLTLSWIGLSVVISIGDAICFELLGDQPNKYGQQRLFGSLGWGVSSIISGVLVDRFSKNSITKNYTPAFIIMIIMYIGDISTSSCLKYTQSKMSVNILKDVGKLISEFRVLIFMLWCIIVGMCSGVIWQFLFWYLEDLAAAKDCDMKNQVKTLEGLLMACQCFIGEIPLFFLSGYIIKRIGHIHSMNLVLLAFGIRLTLYSLLTNPWFCLPIELLHGLTFGLFYATMTSYASIVAPLGTETTIQGFVGAAFEGVGVSLGSFLGGVMYDSLGGAKLFRYYGIGAFIFLILHAGGHYILHRNSETHNDILKDFQSSARYSTPGDAIQMIDDHQDLQTDS